MKIIRITIMGKPIAKKRPRFARRGKFVMTYNSQETEEGRWLLDAREQIKSVTGGCLLHGPIELHAVFHMLIPRGTNKKKKAEMLLGEIKHIVKPDLDNLTKFVKDCLNGEVWRDDSQVYAIMATKRYAEEPSTMLIIKGE